ncbi:MAG: sulfatase-like hydrolase/transferase [Mariniphaga sp.]|nr:sulfatase-like hydrolase/transferase [Mariniphaga sp.]
MKIHETEFYKFNWPGLLKLYTVLIIIFFYSNIFGQQNEKLNILFIAVDDLKTNIGCYGDSLAVTPNIDALAEKGIVFSHAYCQQAVCAPSRASLLTGQFPDQTKVWDLQTQIRDINPDIVTLPQYFWQNEYQTAGVGKIFDYRSVENNDNLSWSMPYGNPYSNSLYDPDTGKPSYWYASKNAKDTIALLKAEASQLGVDTDSYVFERFKPSNECTDVPYDAYVDGAITKVGMQLLEQASGDKPFFIAVGFQRPHLPFNAPKSFWDLYSRDNFQLAKFRNKAQNSTDLAYHNWNELRDYTDIPESGNLSGEKQLELIHGYYAATSYIDFLIGKLTDKLEELGLADNTAIVLWGDHGWHLGDHNLWCKHSNFEEATHAPLIIHYPGQPNPGSVSQSPVEFTDIAPTLCEISGIKIPVFFEGECLIPIIQNPEFSIRTGALSQYPRNNYMGYSLRTNRYRYTKWINKNDRSYYTSELYDYLNDPLETINQAFNPDYASVKDSLDIITSERIMIPSTQTKIKFHIKGENTSGENQNINKCEIIFDEYKQITDLNGSTLFTHVEGQYNYQINAKGYKPVSGELLIIKDTTVTITLERESYNVKFQIKGSWNNLPIDNSTVNFNNQNKQCDSIGFVTFENIFYNVFSLEVNTADGWLQNFDNIEIYSDTTIVLYIDRPSFNILINVIDIFTEANIYNTSISLNNVAFITDTKGLASFNEIEGEYELKIENETYQDLTDTITIISDTTLIYKLAPSHSKVKFKLLDNNTPINNAIIRLASDSLLTSSLGIATFRNIPTQTNYHFEIEKEKYFTISNNFYLRKDTTITIQMERNITGIDDLKTIDFKIWPNPVKDFVNIQSKQVIDEYRFKILNNFGLIIYEKILKGCNNRINIENLKKGSYIIQLQSEDFIISDIIIKN